MIEILFSKKNFLKKEVYSTKSFQKLIKRFVDSSLDANDISIENLINICDQISSNWGSNDSKIKKIILENNLTFLITWLKKKI